MTTECITTPLMPVYLAWALVYPRRVRTRLVAVALFVPLFLTLGVLRLLTVSFPAIIGSPLHLTHGFYQIVAGALLIVAAVRLADRRRATEKMFSRLAAAALAVVGAVALASPYTWLIEQAATAMRARPAVHALDQRLSCRHSGRLCDHARIRAGAAVRAGRRVASAAGRGDALARADSTGGAAHRWPRWSSRAR